MSGYHCQDSGEVTGWSTLPSPPLPAWCKWLFPPHIRLLLIRPHKDSFRRHLLMPSAPPGFIHNKRLQSGKRHQSGSGHDVT